MDNLETKIVHNEILDGGNYTRGFQLFAIITTQRDLFIKYFAKIDFADLFDMPYLTEMSHQQTAAYKKTGIYLNWQDLIGWIEELARSKKKLSMVDFYDFRIRVDRTIAQAIQGKSSIDLEKQLVLLVKELGTRRIINNAGEKYKKGQRDLVRSIGKEISILDAIEKSEEAKTLDFTNLGTVERQQVTWLWKDRIPQGKLTLISGVPNVGKSWFSLWMAAHVTTGEPWPDCPSYYLEKGRVLILANEDGLSDTIVPRLQDAGADLSLIEVINGTKNQAGSSSYFNLAHDIEALEEAIREKGDVKLIIIDPIKAFMGTEREVDGNSDQDVRSVISPLCTLAEKWNFSIIGLIHFSKKTGVSALDKICGSVAWGAVARSVSMISWAPNNDPGQLRRRLFVPVKNNLSPENTSIAFTIEDGIIVIQSWDEFIDANELINADKKSPAKNKKSRAQELLLDALADGPIEAKIIYELAADEGISESTLDKAKDVLGIVSIHSGGTNGHWCWQMPSQDNKNEPAPTVDRIVN